MWAFKTLVGQGPDLRGLPGAGLLLALRDAAVQHRDAHGRRLPRPPGPGAHGAVRARDRRADPGLDDDAVDAAVEPRPRRRARHRLRRDGGATARATSSPRPRLGAYERELASADARRPRSRAASSSAAGTRRCSRSSPTRRTRSRCSPATSSPPRTAPASCTWRPASARTTRTRATPPASRRLPDGRARSVHGRGRRRGPGMHVFDANPDVIRELKDARRRRPPRHATTTRTRTAGGAPSRSSTGRSARWFVQVTKFRDRMVELNQQIRWVPEHIKDGSFGKWLANARDWSISRNRFWGSPIPVWKSDDPRYPRIDVYGSPRRPRARLRRARSTTCTARSSTSSCGPTPTTRPAGR